MTKTLFVLLLAVTALFFTGCDDQETDGDGDADVDGDIDADSAADSDAEGGLGAFGAPCTDPSECEAGVCHEFGAVGRACTQECERDEDCPEGSEGRKCNRQGVCRV